MRLRSWLRKSQRENPLVEASCDVEPARAIALGPLKRPIPNTGVGVLAGLSQGVALEHDLNQRGALV